MTLKIELPKAVIENLERIISETVIRVLTDHVDKIKAEHNCILEKEVANLLQIALLTL